MKATVHDRVGCTRSAKRLAKGFQHSRICRHIRKNVVAISSVSMQCLVSVSPGDGRKCLTHDPLSSESRDEFAPPSEKELEIQDFDGKSADAFNQHL